MKMYLSPEQLVKNSKKNAELVVGSLTTLLLAAIYLNKTYKIVKR